MTLLLMVTVGAAKSRENESSARGGAIADTSPGLPEVYAGTIADVWRRLPRARAGGCTDEELIFDYWPEGGIRSFFCRARTLLPWGTFLQLAPRGPFLGGPHRNGKLDLHSQTDFGHYDPLFVAWLGENLVPAATDPQLRQKTQATYDRFVAPLARTYFAVYAKMKTRPDWVQNRVARYLGSMKQHQGSEGLEAFHSFMSASGFAENPDEADWGEYDPNLQHAAVLFWLRRTADQTAPAFFAGLTRLLETYDSNWLRSGEGPAKSGMRPRR